MPSPVQGDIKRKYLFMWPSVPCMLGTQLTASVSNAVRRKKATTFSLTKHNFPASWKYQNALTVSQDNNSEPTRALHMAFRHSGNFFGIQVVLN